MWSPIQSLSAQIIRTGPARNSPFVSKFLWRDNDRNSVAILAKPRFLECHQVREASGWTCKDPDRIDRGSTINVPLQRARYVLIEPILTDHEWYAASLVEDVVIETTSIAVSDW